MHVGQVQAPLRWALASALLASAWALWWPRSDFEATSDTLVRTQGTATPEPRRTPHDVTGGSGPRDDDGRDAEISAADRDPFFPEQMPNRPPEPLSVPVARTTVLAVEAPPVAAVLPAAPAMNHRVLGTFRDPEGTPWVFLQDGQGVVPARAGMALSSGWRVEAMSTQAITLSHPHAEAPSYLVITEEGDR